MKMHSFTVAAALALGAASMLASATGCELLAAVDRSLIGGGTGGSTTTTTTTASNSGGGGSTTTGTGGTGGTMCMDPAADCPAPPNDCVTAICTVDKVCGTKNVAVDTLTGNQKAGDCKKEVCDGNGAPVTKDDDDVEDDNEVCTTDTCAGGSPVHTPKMAGIDCSAQGPAPKKVCADPADPSAGKCVECNAATQDTECASHVCQGNVCVDAQCGDGVKNGSETDTDCGGTCGACDDGKVCMVLGDCKSSVCTGNVCQVPTCSDSVKNGTETDKDCGSTCPTCADTKACGVASDCTSGVCQGSTCQVPSCSDGVENGTETGQDCGGSCAPAKKCAIGPGNCAADGDCTSGHCEGTACVECKVGIDCASLNCVANVCIAATCSDVIKNQSETGVDCGGVCAAAPTNQKCANGMNTCSVNGDCQSGHCVGMACVECADNGDCASLNCANNVCVVAGCSDGIKNQGETGVDCGGPCSPGKKCANGPNTCSINADCQSGHCAAMACVECIGAGDCPASANECVVPICVANACGTSNLDQTHIVAVGQTSGDCQKIVCNGAGGTTTANDGTDLPVSSTLCMTNPACSGSPLAPSFTPAATGTDCTGDGQPPKHVCGDTTAPAFAGVCVQCNVNADCAAGTCQANHTCL